MYAVCCTYLISDSQAVHTRLVHLVCPSSSNKNNLVDFYRHSPRLGWYKLQQFLRIHLPPQLVWHHQWSSYLLTVHCLHRYENKCTLISFPALQSLTMANDRCIIMMITRVSSDSIVGTVPNALLCSSAVHIIHVHWPDRFSILTSYSNGTYTNGILLTVRIVYPFNQLTYGWIAQLSTENTSILMVPKVITHCAPCVVDAYLNSTLMNGWGTHRGVDQSNGIFNTWC